MFAFLAHAQHEMPSRLAESTFLFPTYLGRSKDTLLAEFFAVENPSRLICSFDVDERFSGLKNAPRLFACSNDLFNHFF